MNYKTYKLLTVEQKEEYNFRFKDDIEYPNFSLPIITLSLVVTILIFTSYITITNPGMVKYRDNIQELLIMGKNIYLVSGIWVIMSLGHYVTRLIIKEHGYKKWKKENNIKDSIKWW